MEASVTSMTGKGLFWLLIAYLRLDVSYRKLPAVLAVPIPKLVITIPDSIYHQLSGTATSLEQTIAGRVVAGIGGGGMVTIISIITKGEQHVQFA